jgi:NADPH-dependent 2,4-dienoyl-CoA reductase/sulfur reductase-like enzyme
MADPVPVLIVGAGPAGVAAACAVSESGMPVTLVDDNPSVGGQIWRGEMPADWRQRLERAMPRVFPHARAIGFSAPQVLWVEQDGGSTEIPFDHLILATGARERLLPFPGWTLPGVMGVGGLQALVKSGLPIAGKRVVMAGTGPLLPAVAASLRKAGGQVLFLAEQAESSGMLSFGASAVRSATKIKQAFEIARALRGVPYRTSSWPLSAARDGGALAVTLSVQGEQRTLTCDYLACGFGLVPNTELAQLAGCALLDGFVDTNEFQQTSVRTVYCAGEPTGIGGVEAALAEGAIAGYHAAGQIEPARKLFAERDRCRGFQRSMESAFELREELRALATPETIVCRCEDVTFAQTEGHLSWRETKLHTRCGMGACQGRVCGPALEFLSGLPMQSVRLPLYPVPVATLASLHNQK